MGADDVTLISPDGASVVTVPLSEAGARIQAGYHQATDEALAAKAVKESHEAGASTAETIAQGTLRGMSLGLTDVGQRAIGGEEAARHLSNLREAHPYASFGSEVIGAVIPALLTGGESLAAEVAAATPVGRAAQLGSSIARLGEGGGAIARIGAKAAGGAVEGALYGAGQGASQLALDDHPLTWERAASAISSNMIFGGATGGVLGGAAGALEEGLVAGRKALTQAAERKAAIEAAGPEVSALDRPGLAKAEKTELARIESERVPQRAQLADDIQEFRKDLREQKLFLATKGSEVEGVPELGKRWIKADNQLRNMFDNPIAMAENPRPALKALQQQQAAMEGVLGKSEALRATYAADESGTRAAALDAIPGALERNKALQSRLRDVAAEPASAQLDAIKAARDALDLRKGKTLLEQVSPSEIAGGYLGHKIGAALGSVGGPVGAVVGAKVGSVVKDLIVSKLAKATAEQLRGTAKVVGAFAGAAGKGSKMAVPLASKILSSVRFGPEQPGAAKGGDLQSVAQQRFAELDKLTAYDATGTPRMRPEARAQVAAALAPIAQHAPVAADRIETVQARKIETYAAARPRRPDVDTPVGGPDRPQYSDSQLRGFARVVGVGENVADFERRCVSGKVTPEECWAYQRIFPERQAHMLREVMAAMPSMSKPLPYARRLTLSMVTNSPVDPAMHPAVLAVLQGTFKAEAGSAGGTMAPRPMPAFGSVKKSVQEPTPAQQRSQGGIRK